MFISSEKLYVFILLEYLHVFKKFKNLIRYTNPHLFFITFYISILKTATIFYNFLGNLDTHYN